MLAAHHPDRVKAEILIGTAATIGPAIPYAALQHFLARHERPDGWDKYNREYWLTNYPDFADHFVRNIFSNRIRQSSIDGRSRLGRRHQRAMCWPLDRAVAADHPVGPRCQRNRVPEHPLSCPGDPW